MNAFIHKVHISLFFELCKIFQDRFFTEHLRTTAPGRALNFPTNGPNSISNANYQKGVCTLRYRLWVDSWIFPWKISTKVFLVLEFSLPFELVKKQLFLRLIAIA